MTRFSALFAILALLPFAAPIAVAQEHETHVTLGHDLHAELSQHYKLPSGLTLSARVGSQDGAHVNFDLAGCTVDGAACTAQNVAGELGSKTLTSVGGALGYQATIDDTDVNLSATASWVESVFMPGLEIRVTRDFWVGYLAWHHDISGAISKSLAEYDLQLGQEGVVRIGIGVKF